MLTGCWAFAWARQWLAKVKSTPLNRLKTFGRAGIVGVDAPAIDDDAAGDRDAVGLRAERLAVRGSRLQCPDASRPALSAGVAARRRHLNLARIGRGGENRIQFFTDHAFDVRRGLGRRRVALFGPHEFRPRRAAVGKPASRKRK